MTKKMKPMPPGTILKEEFMEPLGVSAYRLAKEIHVSATAIGEILTGKRRITPDMALRLGIFFKMSAESWLNLQTRYDLECLEDDVEGRKHIKNIRPFKKAA
jgi:antitoxin HigA-1